MKVSGLLVLACAAALSIGCNGRNKTDNAIANNGTNGNAAYDTSGAAATSGTNAISNSDRNFVNDQLSGGMAEIQLAQLAKDHASSADVKQFAQMMIDDHTKAGDQLKQVASSNAIQQQPQIDSKHQSLMDKLSKMNGSDFDKAYMSAMVDDHEKDVSDVRSRVDENRSVTDKLEGKNPESAAAAKPKSSDDRVTMAVNQWAADTLPTLEHHLDRAKQVKDGLSHSKRTE
jgi:putative membrane protein